MYFMLLDDDDDDNDNDDVGAEDNELRKDTTEISQPWMEEFVDYLERDDIISENMCIVYAK
ncbi:hypothetical protein Clacol_003789 [Clathrus columnatus]|uniref:Uncharacterized protein n=1 Tax=Clathrus columnatus TaxID=1419009 RepID=A0AAV5A968_9AGAM|nr:hypothetical protein Clacol_003789 [Clathrus columnatus]